ncbi:MAG: hypothetical protein ACREXK_06005 [Gammaproteobacteria bacterium]
MQLAGAAEVSDLADRLSFGVPNELRELKGWLLWKAGPRNPVTGKFDKVPGWSNRFQDKPRLARCAAVPRACH